MTQLTKLEKIQLKCSTKFGDKYTILSSEIKQKENTTKRRRYVEVFCNECGEDFEIRYDHFYLDKQKRCNCVSKSKGEDFICNYLDNLNIKYEEQKIFNTQGDFNPQIKRCRYDFYLQEFNMVIEYHGRQHFEFVPHFNKDFFSYLDSVKRDYLKKKHCEFNGIHFIEIHYNQNITDVLDMIFN